jgi:hypothetical protein
MDRVSSPTWRVRILETGEEWEGPLEAYWEVYLDSISDDYTPEVDALKLLRMWAQRVREVYPSGMIPVYWFVESKGQGKFEGMPFENPRSGEEEFESEDFLTFYDWPINTLTGERLNWLTLPVVDKLWRDERMDKGGFIQEATGWKPSILQPFVYLDSLLGGIGLLGTASRHSNGAA